MSLCRDIRNARTSADASNITRTSASDHSQLYGSMAPLMTPTPSGGMRCHRDSDDVDFNLQDDIIITRPAGTAPITPATRKRLKASCEDAARHFDVDPDQLTSFAEVCRITNYQTIFIYYCVVVNYPSHARPRGGAPPQDREDVQKG